MITRRGFCGLSAATIGSALAPELLAERSVLPRMDIIREQSQTSSAPGGEMTQVATAAAKRLLGRRAGDIEFLRLPEIDGHPVYEVSAQGGQVTVRASTAAAAMRGLYIYLREACHAMITWSGTHLDLPARFPSFPVKRTVCPYKFVQYYNPVTFGYSTAFWTWERWERELDWAALHGVNMPLAMIGQEAIWQSAWRKLGIAQSELDSFSTGPAHLPWHRMGNIDRFAGPLPQSWIEGKRQLQKKLMARMREFGMNPVIPAFSGFVPQGYKRVYPQAETFTMLWYSSPRETKTFLLSPHDSSAYQKISKLFIEEYKRQYGPARYYLADSFNEMSPPVSRDRRYDDLAQFGKTVYDGIQAGDPDGTWVMQGWLFYADPAFWDSASIKAYLRDVPSDRMIILDYANDPNPALRGEDPIAADQWKLHDAFFGKQWINGTAPTFGGNNNLKGNLRFFAAQSASALKSRTKGNLAGWSMDPEGIENNEVVYELLTDIGWTSRKIDLDEWIPRYCKARYGSSPAAMQEAWQLLLRSAYSDGEVHTHHAWQTRPSLDPTPVGIQAGATFQLATEKFLACAGKLGRQQLYRNDLIEIVCQAVGGRVDRHLADACAAHRSGYERLRDQYAQESLAMLTRIDGLMNLRPDRRLETWVQDARSWAQAPDEATYYDENARLLITYWGWPSLEDYACRVWSGLIRDYYAARWGFFFQQLRNSAGKDADAKALDIWEATWLASPYRPSRPRLVTDLAEEAGSMLSLSRRWTDPDASANMSSGKQPS